MNDLLDKMSHFLGKYPGLLPLIGIGLIIVNFSLWLIMPNVWLTDSNLLLHLGLIISLVGILMIRPLG